MESLRTSLALRTHFEVLALGLEGQGLGFEAYKSSKMSYLWLEDSTVFDLLIMDHGQLAMTFFSLYLGKRQKARGRFAKPFLFGERLIFRGNLASSCAKTFFWRSPEKKFWRPFFGEHLRLASLTSRGFVLEKSVLDLGLGVCLCPWPWRLCPRLHLWSKHRQP